MKAWLKFSNPEDLRCAIDGKHSKGEMWLIYQAVFNWDDGGTKFKTEGELIKFIKEIVYEFDFAGYE